MTHILHTLHKSISVQICLNQYTQYEPTQQDYISLECTCVMHSYSAKGMSCVYPVDTKFGLW